MKIYAITPKSPAYEPLYKGIRPVGMERYKKHVIKKIRTWRS
jgi:hypothetical protein